MYVGVITGEVVSKVFSLSYRAFAGYKAVWFRVIGSWCRGCETSAASHTNNLKEMTL